MLGLPLTAAAAGPWTLEAALARAQEASPEVRLAARALAEAEASRVGQGVPLPTNPRLAGDYRRLLTGPATAPLDGASVTLDALFEVSGAGGARLAEAEQRVALARAELARERVRARARAWGAWVEAQLAAERVKAVEEDLALQVEVGRASEQRLQTGVAGAPDLAAVAVELASVRARLSEARRQQHAAQLALRAALGLPASEALELGPPPGEPELPRPEAASLARALEQRPELKALAARRALLEAADDRLAREAFPRVGAALGFDASPASPGFGFAGLSVELPVAQRNQGPRAVVAAQAETERTRLALELAQVEREVAQAHRAFTERLQQLQLLSEQALPSAQLSQSLVEQGWRAGRFDVFRLTAATRELQRVRAQQLETRLLAWLDLIELERTSGGLAP